MFVMTPKVHQIEAFDFLQSEKRDYGGLLLPMGTGKTAILLAKAAIMFTQGKIDALLVFSNKGSYRNYDTEQIPMHLSPEIPRHVVYWDQATNKKRIKDYYRLYTGEKELKIFIINIEAISNKKSQALAEARKFIANHKCLLAIDESSAIKNLSASRTDNALTLSEGAAYRMIMTGSAITNGPLDLWSQCYFLSPSALGFSSFYAFRASYCDLEKDSVYQKGKKQDFIKVSGYKHLHDLRKVLDRFCFIRTKDQCLDLPPKVFQKYMIDMSDKQTSMYNTLKKEAMVMINDSQVSAIVVLAQLTKLRQIACGFVKSDDGIVHNIDDTRVKELIKILNETDEKVIIWSCFVPSIKAIEKAIQEEFGEGSVVTYYGETSGEERPEYVKRFQENENCRFFVGNPAVGGYGLNLTQANVVVYYNNDYSLDKRDQSEDRCHRLGQKKSVTYIDMIAKGTLDNHILNVLRGKKDVAQMVLGDKAKALELLASDLF